MGLMVWQDFMFGGAIPPYDKAFRDNVKQEAIEQVTRLRDHPSIVLWCGNNEVQTGWESWPDRAAFRKQAGPAETAKVEQGMRELFDHTLRDVVKNAISPTCPTGPPRPAPTCRARPTFPTTATCTTGTSGRARPSRPRLTSTSRRASSPSTDCSRCR